MIMSMLTVFELWQMIAQGGVTGSTMGFNEAHWPRDDFPTVRFVIFTKTKTRRVFGNTDGQSRFVQGT